MSVTCLKPSLYHHLCQNLQVPIRVGQQYFMEPIHTKLVVEGYSKGILLQHRTLMKESYQIVY